MLLSLGFLHVLSKLLLLVFLLFGMSLPLLLDSGNLGFGMPACEPKSTCPKRLSLVEGHIN